MPDRPSAPPRRPIDDSTFRGARSGAHEAIVRVTAAIGAALDRVFQQRLQHCSRSERRRREHDAWTYLTEGGMAVLGEWSSSMPVSFEQYVVDTTYAWLDGEAELEARSSSSRAVQWTPAMVVAALDGRRTLSRGLGEHLLVHLRHIARLTLRWSGAAADATTEAEDMAQEYAAALLDHDGAILRRWDPARGRSTLHSYLSFIGQRYFWHRIKRASNRPDKESLVIEPPASEGGNELLQALREEERRQAIRARLDATERQLFALVLQGASAEQGAAALGINVNAYYQRKRRQIQKIKAIVAELDGDRGRHDD